jgi:hypothetical protein
MTQAHAAPNTQTAPLPINAAAAADPPAPAPPANQPKSPRSWREIGELLAQEFPPDQVHWRAGPTTKQRGPDKKYPPGTRTLAMPYIDARDVEDRLDLAVGPSRWQDQYRVLDPMTQAVECGIGIMVSDGTWVWKYDVGYCNDAQDATDAKKEPLKAAFSDAFKRAAVKWRIGRHIYRMKPVWKDIDERGSIV